MRIYRPADPQLAQTVIAKRPNPSEEDLDDRPTKYRKPNYPQSTDSNSTSSSYYHPKTPFPFKKILNSSANASQPSYGSADTQWQAGAEPPYQLQPPMPKPHSGKITSGKASRFGPPVESSSLPPRVKPEPIEPDLQNVCRHIYSLHTFSEVVSSCPNPFLRSGLQTFPLGHPTRFVFPLFRLAHAHADEDLPAVSFSILQWRHQSIHYCSADGRNYG